MSLPETVAHDSLPGPLSGSKVVSRVIPGGTRSGWPGQLYVALADLLAVSGLLTGAWYTGVSLGLEPAALTIPMLDRLCSEDNRT